MLKLSNIFRRKKKTADISPSPRLNEKYRQFKELLSENNAVLELMTDIEEKLTAEYLFDMAYVKASCEAMSSRVGHIVQNLNGISSGRFQILYQKCQSIESEINSILNRRRTIPKADFSIPLENVTKDMVDIVGGKNANLGEMKNKIKIPVPEGFAVSTHAYKVFVDHNNLANKINSMLASVDLEDATGINNVSADIRDSFLNAEMPSELEKSILDSFETLTSKCHKKMTMAVRSSAVFEDGEFTFAGQYATALNVTKENLLDKYKEVLASLFSPRAIFYYKSKGFNEEDMAMAVSFLAMIDARTSGIIYTETPNGFNRHLTVNAVWGLGKYAVDGMVTPQTYVVARDGLKGEILARSIVSQDVMLTCSPEGVKEKPVPGEIANQACLSDSELNAVTSYALSIEDYYGTPQDIEWSIDQSGKVFILQTRPLKVASKDMEFKPADLAGRYKLLLDKGSIACRGIGIGKAYVVRSDQDLNRFPRGAVLIAKHTSPKYVMVMDKASAIITDVGSVTGHMASLAREFQVPAILNTDIATTTIEPGTEITVDAVNGNVFQGAVEELRSLYKKDSLFKNAPILKMLSEVTRFIVPLNLVNPDADNFKPEFCRTYHDITRFCHEVSMNEMFGLTEELNSEKKIRLVAGIPSRIFISDLGGGLATLSGDRAGADDVRSVPLRAFLKGISSAKWPEPRGVDVKGFLSLMASAPLEIPAERGMQDELWSSSFVAVSKEYMNFALRLGFHLSTIESYIGENLNDNYVHFFFKGGAAGHDRISRRLKLIKIILEELDFHVKWTADMINAKITKYKRSDLERRLQVLGRLTAYTKNLDVALCCESDMVHYAKNFLKDVDSLVKSPIPM